jgi:tRNA pseudouridine55 synthase
MTFSVRPLNVENTEPRPRVRRDPFYESGILVVDKPAGMTSMDVIRELRKIFYSPRCGHGGTLDPFATGVLPILVNDATKVSERVMKGMKEYEGIFYLGQSYDTQDITGTPLHEVKPIPASLSIEDVQKAAQAFVGEIFQTPPMYSAVKKAGRPLYDYARKGEKVEVEKRQVFVESFEIEERVDERRFRFRVRSAKGVYVRTLIHDLGETLGCGGVLESLRRTQAGPFVIDQAVQLGTLKVLSDIRLHLKPISAVS